MMENQQAELLRSWVQVPTQSDFTIYNLPFGIFRNKRLSPRVGVAIGDKIVDLSALQEAGFFQDIKLDEEVFLQDSLNPFISLGRSTTKKVRDRVQQLLNEENSDLRDHQSRGKIMVGLKEAEMMMPVKVRDCTVYEDQSYGVVGDNTSLSLFPEGTPRKVSTIFPSGTAFHRPKSPIKVLDNANLEFGPCRKLDFGMSLAFVVGKSNRFGESIAVTDAEDYVFGALLFNDWAARDVYSQWGSGGAHAGKSFASGISHWIIPIDALEPFRVSSPAAHPDTMPYLRENHEQSGFDLQLEAYLKPDKGSEALVCQTNVKFSAWSASQLVAQHTVNGATIEIGELIVSGTCSKPEGQQYRSLSEFPVDNPAFLEDRTTREYLQDGDTIVLRGFAEKDNIRVGFGELIGKVLPAK